MVVRHVGLPTGVKHDTGQPPTDALTSIPEVKIQRFATEALALDANRMRDVQARNRYTLALSLLHVQRAQVLDDVAEMFSKRLLKIQ